MSCPPCDQYAALERAAIADERDDLPLPEHAIDGCTCSPDDAPTVTPPEREPQPLYDVLDISPEQWRQTPQRGSPRRLTWDLLVRRLSHAPIAQCKDAVGAWSPALYRDGVRRKASLVRVCAIVVDVDDHGDVDRAAEALSRYRCLIHSTYSSTASEPRCRIVLPLVEPIDARTYERLHAVVRGTLVEHGFGADDGAKDASRASYFPAVREGAEFRVRAVDGALLDARLLRPLPAPPATVTVIPSAYRGDRYVAGALRRAATEIASATPSTRHYTLVREAYGLGRLSVDEDRIRAHLLPAFVAAAGEARASEGERAIRDALRARRGA